MTDDLISRQAAIKYLMANMNWYDEDGYESDEDYKRECITELINGVPSAQTERKRGRWKRHNTYRGDDTSGYVDPDWRCSECGKRANINEYFMYDLTDFCPNCGADMRGEEYDPD